MTFTQGHFNLTHKLPTCFSVTEKLSMNMLLTTDLDRKVTRMMPKQD